MTYLISDNGLENEKKLNGILVFHVEYISCGITEFIWVCLHHVCCLIDVFPFQNKGDHFALACTRKMNRTRLASVFFQDYFDDIRRF